MENAGEELEADDGVDDDHEDDQERDVEQGDHCHEDWVQDNLGFDSDQTLATWYMQVNMHYCLFVSRSCVISVPFNP